MIFARRCLSRVVAFTGLILLAVLTVVPTRASVAITEFMAAAKFSLPDEDGEPSDWIEITNSGADDLSLAGYSLTSNPTDLRRWIFPNVELDAGASLVVFASGKNRTDHRRELHCNFTLDQGGNYLALVEPDGTTVASAFAPAYPNQFATISYGVDSSGANAGYFESPTPGAPNGSLHGPPPAEVAASQSSKMFTSAFRVELSCPTPGATIRYTTDLSTPLNRSPVYSPGRRISITGSTQIRARAFLPGALDGPVTVETYLKMSARVAAFSSNLPLIVQSTLGGGRPPSSGSTTRKTSFLFFFEPDPLTGLTTLTQVPHLTTRAGVRKRGNSSSGWPKYSMLVETWEDVGLDLDGNGSISLSEEQDRGIKPLGLSREADWVINARYRFDLALMRNPLMYDLSNQIGRYAPRTRYVELYNDVNGGEVTETDYFGVYALMDRIEADPNRVDVARIKPWENSRPEVTGGYIFKQDWNDPANTTIYNVPNSGDLLVPSDPDGDTVTSRQESYIENYLSEMTEALRNAPSGINPTTGLHFSDYLDVDSWIDHHCLNILTLNIDWGRHSSYFFKGRNGVVFAGPVWDYDRALGSEDGRDSDPLRWDGFLPRSSMTWFDPRFPWFGYLIGPTADRPTASYIDIRQRHTDRWFELRRGAFSLANLHATIDGLADQIREASARNFTRWTAHPPNGGPFADPLTSGWESEVSHLKGWLAARVAWIDSQYITPPAFNTPGGLVADGFNLTMSSPGVDVYYTNDGSDPRAPRGGIAAGASRFTGAPLLVNSTQIVTARAKVGRDWSAPAEAVLVVSDSLADDTNLVVSEMMYNPGPATAGEIAAGFDNNDLFEYAELLNISNDPVALIGMVFVDGVEFDFNESPVMLLSPGERVLLVKNQAAFEHRYGDAFAHRVIGEFGNDTNLRNSGEQLVLQSFGGSPLRDFTYDDRPPWPQASDGDGYSLVLIAPETNPDHTVASNWRSSVVLHGSPGFSDATTFADWSAGHGGVSAGSDDDHDGRDGLTEYIVAGDPNVPDAGPPQFAISTMLFDVAGVADEYLAFSVRKNLAADDVEMIPQTSTNLVNWDDASGDLVLIEETNHGNGSASLLYRSALPRDQLPTSSFWYRLHMTLRSK